jgi:hypothetical protein
MMDEVECGVNLVHCHRNSKLNVFSAARDKAMANVGQGIRVEVRKSMVRVLLPTAIIALAYSPATAHADDPAKIACETLVRDIAGPNFTPLGWAMLERTVSISYRTKPADSTSEKQDFSCSFQLDTSTGQWTFDREPTADALRCARVSTWDIPAEWRNQRQMKAALEKCSLVMKTEELRPVRLPAVEQQLRQSGQYPIRRQDTGLKSELR